MKTLIYLFSALTLTSCFSLYPTSESPSFKNEYDIVYNINRATLKFSFHSGWGTSDYISLNQRYLKETDSAGQVTYTVYEILTKPMESHWVENRMYVLIDNEVIPLKVEKMKFERNSSISEDTERIEQESSTSITVVTGYNVVEKKNQRYQYVLSDELIRKMKNASDIAYRYYAGPSMFTMELNEDKLNALKELIAFSPDMLH